MIHEEERRHRLQAMGASLLVHAAVFAGIFHALDTTPPVIALDRQAFTVSLSAFAPAEQPRPAPAAAVQPAQPVKHAEAAPAVKRAAPKPVVTPHVRPVPPKPAAVPQPDPKPVLPTTPQTSAPQPEAASLPEASASHPSQAVTSAAPADASPAPDLIRTHSSPSAAPKAKTSGPDATVLGQIRAMIENAITYPAVARRLRIEGVVVLSFMLASDGAVAKAEVLESSGSTVLDRKALKTLWELSGDFPSLESPTQLTIPISFSLKKS
jgi:periplasmic protein TonB